MSTAVLGPRHNNLKNSNKFAKEVREIKLDTDEELRSYDVSTLLTSVLINKALDVIKVKLAEDNTLSEKTPLEPDSIT